jgi:uncharacterized membrane protein
MMTALIPALHIAFVGIWLGCILTEGLFEWALLRRGREAELILVELHKRVDLLVELPAIAGVGITGILMLGSARYSAAMIAKITLGLLAIVANLFCVVLVFRRATAAESGDSSSFRRYDRLQHQVGAVVLIAVFAALALGLIGG